jgi:hypothetical protein
MREVDLDAVRRWPEATTFAACVATILELPPAAVAVAKAGEDPATSWALSRLLGGMGLGLARIADPASFS